MEITQPRAVDQPVIAAGWSRYVPLSGIAFVVLLHRRCRRELAALRLGVRHPVDR